MTPKIDSVTLKLVEYERYSYGLVLIDDKGELALEVPLSDHLSLQMERKAPALKWIVHSPETGMTSLRFLFNEDNVFTSFASDLDRRMWQAKRRDEFLSSSSQAQHDADLEWATGADMADDSDEEELDEDLRWELDSQRRRRTSMAPAGFDEEESNKNLSVGLSSENTFISRGNKIGVFRQDASGELQLKTKIENIEDEDNNLFEPEKMMLHEQDGKLLIMHEDADKKRRNICNGSGARGGDREMGRCRSHYEWHRSHPKVRTTYLGADFRRLWYKYSPYYGSSSIRE